MPPPKFSHDLTPDAPSAVLREDGIESGFIGRLQGLKYDSRPDITHRATLEQSPSSRQDPGNGHTKTLLCFMQLFIVSNHDRTYDAANHNARHFAFISLEPNTASAVPGFL